MKTVTDLPVDVWALLGAALTDGWPSAVREEVWGSTYPVTRKRPLMPDHIRALAPLSRVCRDWDVGVWRLLHRKLVESLSRPSRRAQRDLRPDLAARMALPARWYRLRIELYQRNPARTVRRMARRERHRARVSMGYMSHPLVRLKSHLRRVHKECRDMERRCPT